MTLIHGRWSASAVFFAVLLSGLLAYAGKEFSKPEAKAAATYPAHDSHPDEKVTVAIDPYDTEQKADIFSVDYAEHGYLPVFLVITNDSDEAVSLPTLKAQLVTGRRDKLTPATSDDLYRRLSKPKRNDTQTIPLPIPRKSKVKGAVGAKALEELDRAMFAARAIEPHSTQSGFLFFDISGASSPLAGAHFYLSGLRNAVGSELIYFEIPLEKYLGSRRP
jgi:hypothetical protein